MKTIDSNATVTVSIHEWNAIQERTELLQKLLDEKKFIGFSGERRYGENLQIFSGDEAMQKLISSIKEAIESSKVDFKKNWDNEQKIRELERELQTLRKK